MLALLVAPVAFAQGAADAPLALRATPQLSESATDGSDSAAFVSGNRIEGRSGLETVVTGDAELRRPGLSVHGSTITYDQATDTVHVGGGVRIDEKGDRYTATQARLQLDAFSGFLLKPTYQLLESGAHGAAERIDFIDPDRSTVSQGTYTTCVRPGPDWVPDWILNAARIDIDREEDVAHAKNVVLDFKGVPILAVPALRFPLSGKRTSGWLPPTFGLDSKSGLTLALPYYWNIAPNRDATFTPTVMQRRGVDLGGEFRYLEDNYSGKVSGNFMPTDQLRHRSRWSVATQHSGVYDTGIDAIGKLGASLDINRVSDNDYWRDFSGFGTNSDVNTRLLQSNGALTWGRGNFSAALRAQKWQTLQDVNAPIIPPYDRLPQVTAHWGRLNDRGFDYSVDGDLTRFHAGSALLRQPDADRAFVVGALSRPYVKPWGFFTPKVKLHATQYHFDSPATGGSTSASRVIPTASLDGGLVFERDARYLGRAFTQTLEPRLKYIYTPHRNQSRIPNYDSGLYDFNFATIWSDNAFAGDDRISDNNLVTAGLTSRLLNPTTGAEALRLAIAQRYRFSPQHVTLPGGTPEPAGWSDIMLGAGIHWTPSWSFEGVTQYNVRTSKSERNLLNLRYTPSRLHTLNVAFRRDRSLHSKSLDVGWQWPLGDLFGQRKELGTTRSAGGSCHGRWYSVGRLNYSLDDRRLTDAIAGFEYDAGCWVGRIVVEKLESGVATSTKRVLFQLELVGLGSLGTSPLGTLRDNIRGYETLHEQSAPPPSRFRDYE